jgi:SAM-dependent MidA family methyltransferase
VGPGERLQERLRVEGALPFAAFMEEALYGDGGYYSRPAPRIGPQGDFLTGSSLSPLFGRATARLLRRLDEHLGAPADLLEVGYGTGLHLEAVAAALGPARGRRLLACDRVARALPAGVESLTRLEDLGPAALTGLVLSYELFDALPVHRLIGAAGGGLEELWVALDESGKFTWRPGPLSDPALVDLLGGAALAPGQIADLAPGWAPLYRSLARRLRRGLLLTFDYGFERPQLLDARARRHGTLACYRRHRVHRDPFVEVGGQDLTAHVDFTSLCQAGEEEGLRTFALTRQHFWLAACGLFADLAGADEETRGQARRLLDGDGMGGDMVDPALLVGRAFS